MGKYSTNSKHNQRPLSVYHCGSCGAWHVGHMPKRKEGIMGYINDDNYDDSENIEWLKEIGWKTWWKGQGKWDNYLFDNETT